MHNANLVSDLRTIEAKKALVNRPPPGVASSRRGGPAERKREGGTLQNTNALLSIGRRGTLHNTNANRAAKNKKQKSQR